MIVSLIDTHVEDALDRLLQQYRGKPRYTALLRSITQGLQNVENATFRIDADRRLSNATGVQLDALGEIIGLSRNGADDRTYFFRLLAQVAQNYSDGTGPALINIVTTLFQAQACFLKDPNSTGQTLGPPHAAMAFGVGSGAIPSESWGSAVQALVSAVSAGIGVFYISSFSASGTFAMAGPQGWVRGFGDATNSQAGGGGFAALRYNNAGI